MTLIKREIRRISLAALLLILIASSSGCQFSLIDLPEIPGIPAGTETPGVPSGPSATPHPLAQVTFIAVIPEPLAAGEFWQL